MAIQDILNKLSSELFMKAMRQHIVDGLEQVYKDATAKGDTNMEVLRARGSSDSLNDRLDGMNAQQIQTSTELSQKANINYVDAVLMDIAKGGPRDLFYSVSALKAEFPNGPIDEEGGTWLVMDSTFNDGAHSFIWDSTNSEWKDLGVYQAMSVGDYTITWKKTDYLKPVFVNKITTIENGIFYPYSTGDKTTDSSKATSIVIPVVGGQKIKIRKTGLGSSNNQAHAFFWRESLSKNGGLLVDGEFTVPLNSTIMRIGFAANAKDKIAVFDASQEYGFVDEYQKITKPDQLFNKVVTREATTYIDKKNNNKFNLKDFIADYSYSLTGEISTTNGMGSFEFPVKLNEQYEMNYVGLQPTAEGATYVTFWGDLGFITSVQAQNFTVPNNPNINIARIAVAPAVAPLTEIFLVGKKEKYVDSATIINATQVEGLQSKFINISICADSISTFKGNMVLGNRTYYPNSDVDDLLDTWWGKLIKNKHWLRLLVNNSWSGSAITPGKGNGTPHSDGATAIKHLSKNGNDPDVIVFHKGTNDMSGNVLLSDFETEYRKVIQNSKTRYPEAKLFVGTLLYRSTGKVNENGHTVEDFNTIIKKIANEERLTVIDFYNCGINESNAADYLIDGLHPNAAGQDLMYQESKKPVYDYL